MTDDRTLLRKLRDRLCALPATVRHAAIGLHDRLRPRRPAATTDREAFAEVLDRSRTPTDISTHLPALFAEAVAADADLVVELGVRGGESTFVFERAGALTGATLVSVDVEDCSELSSYERWWFVEADDIGFAERFPVWCRERGLAPEIDVLFVDTVHDYAHTREEIESWFPHLGSRGRAIFHDSNQSGWYRREDGTIGKTGDMERGVIRAIEDFLGASLDETRRFVTLHGEWIVRHEPLCNGLTVLERSPALARGRRGGG